MDPAGRLARGYVVTEIVPACIPAAPSVREIIQVPSVDAQDSITQEIIVLEVIDLP